MLILGLPIDLLTIRVIYFINVNQILLQMIFIQIKKKAEAGVQYTAAVIKVEKWLTMFVSMSNIVSYDGWPSENHVTTMI